MREEGKKKKARTETSLGAEAVPAQEPEPVWYLPHDLITFPKNPVSVNVPWCRAGAGLRSGGAQEGCWGWGLCPALCTQHRGTKDRKSFKFIKQEFYFI